MLEINDTGILASIQDGGRVNYTHLGITTSGVADKHAYYWLNRLLQNEESTPCIEVTLGGFNAICHADTQICVTGAAMKLTINDIEKPLWCTHQLRCGDSIQLALATSGCRAYLGVKHGFTLTPSFDSYSTNMREGIAPFVNGQCLLPLRKGDKLPFKQTVSLADNFALKRIDIPFYPQGLTINLVAGYQSENFEEAAWDSLLSQQYTLSPQSNRMAALLSGEPIDSPKDQLYSEGICYGAVQVPPNGQPVILLNDRQTLGGYPKIGSVLSVDAMKLTQCQGMAKIRFNLLALKEAQQRVSTYWQNVRNTSPIAVSSTA